MIPVLHTVGTRRITMMSTVGMCAGVTRPLGNIDPRLYKLATDSDDDDVELPDNHIGRVWFAVKYEPQSEKLLVTLVKARNLAGRGGGVAAAATGGTATSSSSSTVVAAGDFFVR